MSEYYFAFGSNMDLRRMKDRIGQVSEMRKGIMKDWKLVFNKINDRIEGADCKTAEVKNGKCPFCGKIVRNK